MPRLRPSTGATLVVSVVVILAASTIPVIFAEAQVATDVLQRIGMNVDMQTMEWGSVVARRASREPVDKGGWNIFYTYLGGMGNISPGPDIAIRASGADSLSRIIQLPRRLESGTLSGGNRSEDRTGRPDREATSPRIELQKSAGAVRGTRPGHAAVAITGRRLETAADLWPLVFRRACDEPGAGRRRSKSATRGGRARNHPCTRRTGASLLRA